MIKNKSVSKYTEREFIIFTTLKMGDMKQIEKRNNPNKIMDIVKNMDIALARYAEKHPMDMVQEKAIQNNNILINLCRFKFKKSESLKMLRNGCDRQTIKKQVREKWDAFWKEYGLY